MRAGCSDRGGEAMRITPPILSRKQDAADDLVRAIQASVAAKIAMDADGTSERMEAEYVESLDVLAQAFAAMTWAAE